MNTAPDAVGTSLALSKTLTDRNLNFTFDSYLEYFFLFLNPQLSRTMGLDVIARNRDWHIQPCSKDDVEGARQGLCKLVTFMCPEKETTAQNQI